MNGTEMLTVVLAQPDFPGGEPPGAGQGSGFGKSTPVGLFLLIVLLIGVAFLIRSMSKHVRGLPTKFDEDRAAAAAPRRVQRAEAAAAARAESDAEEDTGDAGAGSEGARGDDAPEAEAPEPEPTSSAETGDKSRKNSEDKETA